MPAIRLPIHRVEKPWGRHILWSSFEDVAAAAPPLGEIWFEPADKADDPELLVKYLFTSEKLSVQVHPDDDAARAAGYPRGKDEAWLVLAADPEATIGIGLTHEVTHETLRAAALDGSIEALLDWKPVKAGDVFYSPAGTIHAIGAGVTVLEVQQNLDLTYRLYDYGRPRALHLDEGLAVAKPMPFVPITSSNLLNDKRQILVEGGKFVMEKWLGGGADILSLPNQVSLLFIPLHGSGTLDGQAYTAGECWNITDDVAFCATEDADIVVAYPGAQSDAKLRV